MYIFIVNPIAGNGGAKKAYSNIAKTDAFKQIDSKCFFTEYFGHAERIAKHLTTDFPEIVTCVVVIGGDGTLHEVLNGLCKPVVPVSFIPAGSGNDFARGCDIKGKPVEIFQRIIHQNSKPYWLGCYQEKGKSPRNIVNSIGFGFDAEIAKAVNESKYKKLLSTIRLGKISYVIGLIKVLFRFRPMNLEMIVDGKKYKLSNCWMVTIAHHPFYGGGMKIIPDATIQAGVFPVLIIHSISKWKVLGVFMTVFSGKHVNFKEVELMEANHLEISSKKKIPYQVDGQTDVCFSCVITKQQDAIKVVGA
ncbi:diacylglycerol/lipid kinase family protein [Virgibacillus litoralis]|uniref:YegS/Rv2252/BmrU family lipid kinase n=1 Tax=Virgibacillus litoralis TaxID=578221 RepID=A0ABS4HAF0_9BACI|nr:diacylglycerol kinase family protein [Virgibacillus litoralis]MBP1947848.1 YegS/Rv2252/BmrU family lipid kinase [Virgibacillus litoralis]